MKKRLKQLVLGKYGYNEKVLIWGMPTYYSDMFKEYTDYIFFNFEINRWGNIEKISHHDFDALTHKKKS